MTSEEATTSNEDKNHSDQTMPEIPSITQSASSVSEMTDMVQRLSSKIVDNFDNSCSWGDDVDHVLGK